LTRPSLSVIIPTLNEAATIREAVQRALRLGADEVIVCDGGSTDGTVQRVPPPARVIEVRANRGEQLNAGARAANGDILLFLHADTRPAPGAIDAVRQAIARDGTVGGNLNVQYDGHDRAARWFTRINRWRRRAGIFYGDSGIFCRRSVFERLGGYKPYPVLEDYEFARRLRKAGKLALLDTPILVSARRWRRGGLWPTLWSWFCIQGLYLLGVPPHRLARLYRDVR